MNGKRAAKRSPLSKKARFNIFKRDGFSCRYCGRVPPQVMLEVDHIVPVFEGGNNNEENLITACFECNRGKGRVSLDVVPETLAERGRRLVEMEAQLSGYREIVLAKEERLESECWEIIHILSGQSKETTKQRLASIKLFIEKLPLDVVRDAAGIARARFLTHGPTQFKYFCGICWRRIREMEE
jgi:hypothetical protein